MAHISRLTITELDSLLANRNQPESRTPSLSDEELSLLLFAEEAEGLLNIAKNHVTSETELEDVLFNALLEVEETAEYDRAIAIALSQGRNPPPRPQPRVRRQDIHPIPGCIVCLEPIDSGPVVSTGCGHHLDVTCLRIMFENALKDASLFPPRCCDDLDLEDVHEHLDAGLISRFERRALEFRTKDPVYCCNPHCSTFMRGATPTTPVPILCAECGTVTCGSCKREAHPGETCASRELDEAMLEFAKARGWSRCPSCLHVVERTEGCPHMICLCQAQFCYLCAAVWKTCSCT
ncbi:hypothetical protein C8T65DRAFT_563522 [Cerioporus squamosus]|nr:hypothetical protein C8T65DRAFT_563522 [Cerioporus squamosus]